jgi:predicted Kef-type K+ transport protein
MSPNIPKKMTLKDYLSYLLFFLIGLLFSPAILVSGIIAFGYTIYLYFFKKYPDN